MKNDRIILSESLKEKLLDSDKLPDNIVLKGRKYTVQEPVAAGFKAAVWKVIDEYGRPRVAKLAICEDYENRSYLEEIHNSASLEGYDVFAKFIDAGISNIRLVDEKFDFVCFIEEWIDGETLHDFLRKNVSQVTVPFFISYTKSICSALKILKVHDLRHDDLHSKNVMVAKPKEGELDQNWTLKIIDNGSLKKLSIPTKKTKDDHLNFVDHLVEIWNTIHDRVNTPIKDRVFLKKAKRIIDSMLDNDLTMALRDPIQIHTQFASIYSRTGNKKEDKSFNLLSPFEYISAEHISDDRLLLSIFSKSCPWLGKVSTPDPCLVTGPRGCGKSTIFRWLSLKPHLTKTSDQLMELRIAGFYISCSTSIQNQLGWINTDALADRFRKEIIHYFNLIIAKEIILTLIEISKREDKVSFWGLGEIQERSIYECVTNTIRSKPRFLVQGVSKLTQLFYIIKDELYRTHDFMRHGKVKTSTSPSSFIGSFSEIIANLIPFFQTKKVTFLIDDFSVHRVPESVQLILNSIIWERRPSHIFKISSEKYGVVLHSLDNVSVDLTRELVEIDCGREFIALDDSKAKNTAREFTKELLEHRLRSAKYKGTVDELIGASPTESLAKSLVSHKKKRYPENYYGLGRIAELCSGDISHLLLIYRRIFEAGGVTPESKDSVSPSIQDKIVRQVSRELFENIRAFFPCGPEMYNIVNAFGNFARKVLEKGKKQTNGQPTQCPRIEIDQPNDAAIDVLARPQQEIAKELIRRAIFIDMLPGLSRHDNVSTLRWNIRRIFLPAFGAALAKNDSLKENPDWFKFFITSPTGACDMKWKKWSKEDDKQSGKISKQMSLLDQEVFNSEK